MLLSIPMVVVLLGSDRSATLAQVEARAKLDRHMLAQRAADRDPVGDAVSVPSPPEVAARVVEPPVACT